MNGIKPFFFILLTTLFYSETKSTGHGHCAIRIPGIKSTKLLLTETTDPMSVTIDMGDMSECILTIVAIGGGGGDIKGAMAGGGSGYVEWTQRTVRETFTVEATVGNATTFNYWAPCCGCGARAGASAVIWWERNEVLLIAQPGGDAHGPQPGDDWHGAYGGDGYCGGGEKVDCAGNGGMDGSDGTCTGGGKGSGVNVRDIPVKQFSLTPGAGGCNGSGGRAGGGGGVVIDGDAPWDGASHDGHPMNEDGTAACGDKWARNGEGYGAGGFGYGNTGLNGAVLFEIEPIAAEYKEPVEDAPSLNMICTN